MWNDAEVLRRCRCPHQPDSQECEAIGIAWREQDRRERGVKEEVEDDRTLNAARVVDQRCHGQPVRRDLNSRKVARSGRDACEVALNLGEPPAEEQIVDEDARADDIEREWL